MAIFKCKMCGGQLEITEGASTCTCEYCGTEQTLPKVIDENMQGLFNRANVLRMKAEFDKAAEIYEKILQSSGTEAEAYWGLILCKYGIEYVEDPATYKRVPTCHRASYDAVTADDDYKMAIQYADLAQRSVYEAEARQIDEIQKGIVAIAQHEDPYDVFICYKETDESGKRTQDSVIANDIYYQLTQEGYKVFYAAITLEDKLGQEYEPYIFSALNSSRVMLTIGTKPEYFNAVWVKNEWSRFLKIMKKDRARILIPCYRDMDAYELPEEFSHLQAQDMSKIGFITDLIRGIKKVASKEQSQSVAPNTVKQAPVVQATTAGSNVDALIKRGNMALEDGEWDKADGFFEEVLNQDAECAEAYLGKLLSKYKQRDISSLTQYYISKYESSETEELEACPEARSHIDTAVSQYMVLDYLSDFEIRKKYVFDRTYISELSFRKQQKRQELSELSGEKLLVRAQQYAVGETKDLIDKILADITSALDRRIEAAKQADDEKIASVESTYEKHLIEADLKVKELNNNALERQESTYNSRVEQMNQAQNISDYEKIRDLFKNMHGYKDTEALAKECQVEIEKIKEEERIETERLDVFRRKEAERLARKKKTIITITSIAVVVCIAIYFLTTKMVIPKINYNKAIERYMGSELSSAQVGDEVYFGQNEWIVIDKSDGKIFVVRKYAIGRQRYNTESISVTWKSSTMRKWLNSTYLSSEFDLVDRTLISTTTILNSDNTKYATDGGNNTKDKVFLLSIDEVCKYFTSDSDRQATFSDGTLTWWWLRSPGSKSDYAAHVNSTGKVYEYGSIVNLTGGAARPAMWIDISDL